MITTLPQNKTIYQSFLDTTALLLDLLDREMHLLTHRLWSDIGPLYEEKVNLIASYQSTSIQVNQGDFVKTLSPDQRVHIQQQLKTLQTALQRNAERLSAYVRANQTFLEIVIEEVVKMQQEKTDHYHEITPDGKVCLKTSDKPIGISLNHSC